MKKILFLIIGLFLCHNAYATVPNIFANDTVADALEVNENFDYFETKYSTTGGHTHDGSNSKYISKTQDLDITGDLAISDDIAISGDLTIAGTAFFSSNLTVSGTAAFTGDLTSTGSVYLDGTVHIKNIPLTATGTELNYCEDKINLTSATEVTGILPLTNAGTGASLTNDPGGIIYCGATAFAVLADGTSGLVLTSGGTSTPTWSAGINAAQYFEPDSTCVVAFDNGSLALDLSTLQNAIALTSLAEADLVAGLVSPQCYDYDNANDYATIATHALQAGMAAVTMEAVIYRDTSGANDFILHTVTDGYLRLYITDTNIVATIITGDGTEAVDVAHGLSGSGIDQTVYVVIAWNNAGAAEIYVNGVDVGDGDNAGNGTVSDSANGINIGADSNNENFFPGKIDGVRILRRKMGVAEALARYNTFK